MKRPNEKHLALEPNMTKESLELLVNAPFIGKNFGIILYHKIRIKRDRPCNLQKVEIWLNQAEHNVHTIFSYFYQFSRKLTKKNLQNFVSLENILHSQKMKQKTNLIFSHMKKVIGREILEL